MTSYYLLNGSFAYDSVLIHKGLFETEILPHEISRLNVAFGVDSHQEEFGGCAGNIAYNAALLGDSPLIVGNVGSDFNAYADHLTSKGLNLSRLVRHKSKTAHAWILTDENNNQVTAFSKGAMANKVVLTSKAFEFDCKVWHLAPEHIPNTLELVATAIEIRKKYFLDPGQATPGFLSEEFKLKFEKALENASGLFVNEYEACLIEEGLGVSLGSLINNSKLEFVVKTLGAKGLDLITQNSREFIPSIKPSKVVDPTGCGDAFRAGFLHEYLKSSSLRQCCVKGAEMGSLAVAFSGGQNHFIS